MGVAGAGGLLGADEEAATTLARFYMCPSCGLYMPSSLWKRGRAKGKEVWYCEISQVDFAALFPDRYAVLHSRYKQWYDVPVGCNKRYRPFANGPGMVLEFKTGGGWMSMLAELPPPALSVELEKCKRDFFGALNSVTADDLRSAIPVILPKCNPLPDMIEGITGVGKLDLPSYEGLPVMDEVNWWRFAKAVASKNLDLLQRLFDKASVTLRVSHNINNDPLEPMLDDEEETFDW